MQIETLVWALNFQCSTVVASLIEVVFFLVIEKKWVGLYGIMKEILKKKKQQLKDFKKMNCFCNQRMSKLERNNKRWVQKGDLELYLMILKFWNKKNY